MEDTIHRHTCIRNNPITYRHQNRRGFIHHPMPMRWGILLRDISIPNDLYQLRLRITLDIPQGYQFVNHHHPITTIQGENARRPFLRMPTKPFLLLPAIMTMG
jgi:hypothetical protein